MRRIRLFHWKAAEAQPLIAQLKAARHSIEYSEKITSWRDIRDMPVDAFVIDLTRTPSHGREVAVALRGSPKTRHLPIVFVDGEPEKVETVKRLIPDAIYTSSTRLITTLKKAKAPANPVVPTQMMDRFAGRTVAQKMGIAKDMRVAVIDAPGDYERAIGPLPEGAYFEEDAGDCKLTLWFVHDYAGFQAVLPRMRRIAERSRLWIVWRKGQENGLDSNTVRLGGIDVGLVDYKICKVNEVWSGMVFAVKKAPAQKAAASKAKAAR